MAKKATVLLHYHDSYQPSCSSELGTWWLAVSSINPLLQASIALTLTFLYLKTVPWGETGGLPGRYFLRSRRFLQKFQGNKRKLSWRAMVWSNDTTLFHWKHGQEQSKLSKALQVQFHHVDLKAAALPTCLHRHIKPHQSLFLLGEKSFSTFYGTQDKWQAKFTARGSTVLIRASAFQSGADLCPDNPGCGKSSSACLCDVPRMSVIQGSVRARGRGNMQLVKVETWRECDMAAPLLILDIAHCKVFINF